MAGRLAGWLAGWLLVYWYLNIFFLKRITEFTGDRFFIMGAGIRHGGGRDVTWPVGKKIYTRLSSNTARF